MIRLHTGVRGGQRGRRREGAEPFVREVLAIDYERRRAGGGPDGALNRAGAGAMR